MAYADTTRKIKAIAGGVGSLNMTLNSTVAGNLVVVGSSSYESATTPVAVASDAGNTWSNAMRTGSPSGSPRIEAAINYSVLTTGGNRTINVDPGTSSAYDMSIYAHEFSGNAAASLLSGTPVSSSGTTSTTSDTTAMTPADNDVLIVAMENNSTTGAVTENVSPGETGFTLSNEQESGSGAEPGSMVFKIISGAPATRRAAWTIPAGTLWRAGIAAFKPLAGVAANTARPRITLQAVQRAGYF